MRYGVKNHIGCHNYVQVDYSRTENLHILIQHFLMKQSKLHDLLHESHIYSSKFLIFLVRFLWPLLLKFL